jgi:hypothetical protein
MAAGKARARWRRGVWLVLVGCVTLIAGLLTQGIFPSADFTFKAEVFAAIFLAGCAFLILSRRSAKRARDKVQR